MATACGHREYLLGLVVTHVAVMECCGFAGVGLVGLVVTHVAVMACCGFIGVLLIGLVVDLVGSRRSARTLQFRGV
jgi:non-ribosomal peptide synthetase component E (peptide arylation enzyme)